MTRTQSTCTQSETVNSVMEQMTAGKFRHVPVVEHEQLVGIVSIGDVVKHRLTQMERESETCTTTSRRPSDCQRMRYQYLCNG
jgi:predicted transcriptional regulator